MPIMDDTMSCGIRHTFDTPAIRLANTRSHIGPLSMTARNDPEDFGHRLCCRLSALKLGPTQRAGNRTRSHQTDLFLESGVAL